MDTVTVCVTYHNEPIDVLANALASATRQTHPPCEILLINDGGEPTLHGLAASNDVLIKAIHITNRGLPAARNTGLMLAKGTAFLPLDADDWLEDTYIEKTLPLLEGADVVLTGLQEHGPTRNGAYMPGYDRPWDQVTEEILWSYNRFFYCSLFRTQTLREIGGYHPAMAGWPGVHGGYEDWDVWIDLASRGAVFTAVNELLFNYTTKPDSMLTRAETNRAALVAEMKRHHRR